VADITWRTTAFPDAIVGVAYEASLAETGSLTAVTNCTVATGALPPGLAINADHVRVTGTVKGVNAALPKVYTFTLTMTDTAGGVTSGSFTITVRASEHRSDVTATSQPVVAQMAAMWPLTQS
jgi:hypothetical protein